MHYINESVDSLIAITNAIPDVAIVKMVKRNAFYTVITHHNTLDLSN